MVAAMPVTDATAKWAEELFATSIVPTLVDYIKIPNKSPMFDPAWKTAGHMDRAVELLAGWARAHLPDGATLEVVRLGDRTPVIFMDIPATGGRAGDTVLLYGHLDKQPEMTGWREGLGPWTPVLDGDKLYGRGGADDGYAIFATLTALGAMQRDKLPRARCVVLIEACEESGSYDLPAYIEHLAPRMGELSLVVCLDSGCANYDQLWSTTSLRGLVIGNLEVSLLREGVHSGDGSGVVASSFRVIRQLLDRLEDSHTGMIKLGDLAVAIPRGRVLQAAKAAEVIGDEVWNKFPFQDGAQPVDEGQRRADLESHVAARAGDHGRRRPAADRERRQRDAPAHALEAVAARAADARRDRGAGARQEGARGGSAVRREGQLRAARREQRTGMRPRSRRGSRRRSTRRRTSISASRRCTWAKAAASRSWACSARSFRRRSSASRACSDPGANAQGPNEFLHIPTARRLSLCVADVLAMHAKQ